MILDNSSTFNIAETATNNMIELFRFFFLGKYTYRDYEYTFYLNGGELKADDCFSNNFGRTYCVLNDVRYNNVEYTRTLVNEYEKTNLSIPLISYLALFYLLAKIIINLFVVE